MTSSSRQALYGDRQRDALLPPVENSKAAVRSPARGLHSGSCMGPIGSGHGPAWSLLLNAIQLASLRDRYTLFQVDVGFEAFWALGGRI